MHCEVCVFPPFAHTNRGHHDRLHLRGVHLRGHAGVETFPEGLPSSSSCRDKVENTPDTLKKTKKRLECEERELQGHLDRYPHSNSSFLCQLHFKRRPGVLSQVAEA